MAQRFCKFSLNIGGMAHMDGLTEVSLWLYPVGVGVAGSA